jgi:glycyl-tRNA synthetase beta chain
MKKAALASKPHPAKVSRPAATPAAKSEKLGELLFEIGCEEIPAGMLPKAAGDLRGNLEKILSAENLSQGVSVEAFAAPRRLVAWVRGLPVKQADAVSEVTGPPKSVAYDSVGEPTRAAASFAEKQGITLKDIYLIQTPKGEYLAAKQVRRGRVTANILTEALPRAIHDLSWPRSMTWTGLEGARFIRPIRWIVAVFDGQPLKFSFAGVAAGSVTQGHRFLSKEKIRVSSFADYEKKLAANGVIVRPSVRREKIEKEIASHAKSASAKVHEDRDLLQLVTYLNEYPTVITGDFDPAFLALPDEILVTVMRGHQKYFAMEKRNGELAPHFLAVINLAKDTKGLVRAGHERVLKARFADAQFFWSADQKCRLADYLPKLEKVIYESRLGSYRDKVERFRAIARSLAEQWFNLGIVAHVADADRAAELAKCDLVTEMVREFPELQGVVGGLYARAQGESDDVADAVYDHYRPVGLDDPIPRNLIGCAVALADKMDSVAGCFAVGLAPTGSSDPYALRRAALGVVKIILERKLTVSLSHTISVAAKTLHTLPPKLTVSAAQQRHILDFLLDRAKFVFREKLGFGYDEVNAVLRAGADDLVDAHKRLVALRAIRKSKNFEPLAVSFKRIRKILEKAQLPASGSLEVKPDLFQEDAERELHAAELEAAAKVQFQKKTGEYDAALQQIAGLRKAVDRFFEEVMVMAEDEEVRRNRLALLSEILREFTTIADFSEIGSDEPGR